VINPPFPKSILPDITKRLRTRLQRGVSINGSGASYVHG
jgi:hypothetical protein